jgi:hypothetical protein
VYWDVAFSRPKHQKLSPESHYLQKNTGDPLNPSANNPPHNQYLTPLVANPKQTGTIFLQSCCRAVTTAEFVHAKTSPRWL